ncbi:toll/interleukin-1 receptor domain-containing protein [Adhaeribacter soli]|uniref:TIR domain-containing protein n=1 Tax=Adhaeribacter soli TaxID=2607655 RepID=A0A5N1J4S5_9BACT|nr:toll/interleukin-1 receptor domain-containing protein [Adhaeribacter soli]KAA9345690.1 TIR domain-containing protein [Adhaeribacter soli]
MDLNSIRSFNTLFNTINVKGTPAYFSGPRFINLVRTFDPSFPDYQQYMDLRNGKSLSTSRKAYFYDILMSFDEPTRTEIIKLIWQEVEESKNNVNIENKDSEDIFNIFNLTPNTAINPPTPKVINQETIEEQGPIVFISYSWDNEEHKKWVIDLANKLFENGVRVLLDVYELGPGHNMFHFMENSVNKSDKVLIIFTPNYKLKSEKREGGVGFEYSILNTELYKTITTNKKYIPVLRSGTIETSVPNFMQQFIAVDMINDQEFDKKFSELLLSIYDKPQLPKPALGKRPDFIN